MPIIPCCPRALEATGGCFWKGRVVKLAIKKFLGAKREPGFRWGLKRGPV